LTKREAIVAVSTERNPIPKSMTTMATIRPSTDVGYTSGDDDHEEGEDGRETESGSARHRPLALQKSGQDRT
jgi:hypothetical protein